MKHDLKTYIILMSVFVLSISGSCIFPAGEVMQGIVASPGVMALIAALYQLMRDQAAYEKHLEIQQRQFQFTLGAASHMANYAFDKHADFSEQYMKEIQSVVTTIFAGREALMAPDHAKNLLLLRQKYAVWLTNEVNLNLEKFEEALRKLGAEAKFNTHTTGDTTHEELRSVTLDSAFRLSSELLGLECDTPINNDIAVNSITEKVKSILDVEELTAIRKHLIGEASKALKIGT